MAKTFRLPKMFRKPEPDFIDGQVELGVALKVHELLAPLHTSSQKRVLNVVNDILKDNEAILDAFDEALADNDYTRSPKRRTG